MTQRLKAIPTTYHGIEFRSKLEAKYAQAFDRLGIVWEYEGHGFRFDDGTCYCPDFYMPEIDTYFEVKGVLDEESLRKIKLLVMEMKRVVVGGPDGSMTIYDFFNDVDNGYNPNGEIVENKGYLSVCEKCKKAHFSPSDWFVEACPNKEHDESNCDMNHLWKWQEDHENVFEAAGWERGW
jgi:hypothetical protein